MSRIIVKHSRQFGWISGILTRALARVKEPTAQEIASGWLLTDDTGMDCIITCVHTPDVARAAAKFLLAVAKDAERKNVKAVA